MHIQQLLLFVTVTPWTAVLSQNLNLLQKKKPILEIQLFPYNKLNLSSVKKTIVTCMASLLLFNLWIHLNVFFIIHTEEYVSTKSVQNPKLLKYLFEVYFINRSVHWSDALLTQTFKNRHCICGIIFTVNSSFFFQIRNTNKSLRRHDASNTCFLEPSCVKDRAFVCVCVCICIENVTHGSC